MPDPSRPPFWSYAAKAIVALATGVVVSGGVILAAVADDHVTSTEWVTIVLTVLGAIVGPTAVYATRNAPKPFVGYIAGGGYVPPVVDPAPPPVRREKTWAPPEPRDPA